ncbi:hypothetical protein [Streptomyces sp. AM 2-1-1]|uniref:hypothetical protein n=1 Tax=Streptomyces sp. AM 2-1-1 TaxID=3028709 RepID=UPI0023B8EED6|nr:hypothetical protein [Streptomyces sp. AM 2-1-1]WEH40781.1 hypothetical protein PZB77_15425 [Streptomyces sp. AM 2-1-1]
MSDHEEQMTAMVAERLTSTYGALVAACALLPIPIALPTGVVSNLEMVPALRRIETLAEEQPMPELQQSELYTAAMLWLAAADVFSLLVEEYVEARAAGALGILLTVREAIHELGTWLLTQED